MSTGELEKAAAGLRTAAAELPERPRALRELGIHLPGPWKLEKVLAERQRLAPRAEQSQLRQLGDSFLSLNRLDEAEAIYKQAEERKLESEHCYQAASLAFLKGDAMQMAQVAAAAMGKPSRNTSCWPSKQTRRRGTAG